MTISGGKLVLAIVLGVWIAVVALWFKPAPTVKPDACKTAAISQRAAQICSTELVGCSLTFEQVKQVLAEQEAAKGCE